MPANQHACKLFALDGPAARWWDTLPEEAKRELELLWSDRAESCRFACDDGEWKELPIVVGAVHFPNEDEDAAVEGEDWNQDLYEYLINHPELALIEHGIIHHICTRHPHARRVLRQGVIPKGFMCKLDQEACPMRALLAVQPGCDVRLFPIAVETKSDPSVTSARLDKPAGTADLEMSRGLWPRLPARDP